MDIKTLMAMERVRRQTVPKLVAVEKPVTPAVEAVPVDQPWRLVTGAQLPVPSTTGAVSHKMGDLAGVLGQYGLAGALVRGTLTGPTVTTHLVELQKGTRASGLMSREEDLARDLGLADVRILGSVPGYMGCIGVEVPNEVRGTVSFRDTFMAYNGKSRLPIVLGASSTGRPVCLDLVSMPHLLVAGTTGSGKSVFLHSVICSLVSTLSPEDLKLHLVDPKRVEFKEYGKLPHLDGKIIHEQLDASKELEKLVEEMADRFKILERVGVKDIQEYNQSPVVLAHPDCKLPYRVLVVDEYADLMMSGTVGTKIEGHIIRLAQKARAVGIHIIIATQRPSERVITKDIRDNMPARIAFKVVDKAASRLIIGDSGADSLLGKGDMLVQTEQSLYRVQGAHLDADTIRYITSTKRS
jgi:S-DNA-T family DNA segregation ATPase FtsK/SpoIIIE